jgi:purine-binding chemotaxis protein CheW
MISTNDTGSPEGSFSEILRQRARVLSQAPTPEEDGDKISVLSFSLAGELYGIELGYLTETRQSFALRHVPHAPSYLVGIVNLRGELLPVLDLCPLLGLPQQRWPNIVPALLILSLQRNKLGLAAQRAEDIVSCSLKELKPPPISLESEHAVLIKGEVLIKNRPLILLDVEKLVQDPRFAGEEKEHSTRKNE